MTRQKQASQDYLGTMRRLQLLALLPCAAAIALPIVANAINAPLGVVMALVNLGLAWWTIRAVVQSYRTESAQRVSDLELWHMLIWANTALAAIFGSISILLFSQDEPALWWLSFVVVLALGWAALHSRLSQVSARA